MPINLCILLLIGCFTVGSIAGYNDKEDIVVTLVVKGNDIEITVPYNPDVKSVFFSTELDDKCNTTGYTFQQNANGNGSFSFTQRIERELKSRDKLHVLGVFETDKQVRRESYYFEIDKQGNGVLQTECKDNPNNVKIKETQIDDQIIQQSYDIPIFDETFKGSLSKWTHEIRSPLLSDESECAVFTNNKTNCDIINGTLHITANWFTPDRKFFLSPCTATRGPNDAKRVDECGPFKYPYPELYSAKLRSLTSFRYGRVEVRARFPIGDWLFPYIMLQSKKTNSETTRGTQIRIAYSRGNRILNDKNDTKIGSDILFGSTVVWMNQKRHEYHVQKSNVIFRSFGEKFHDYSIIWHRDVIIFKVDGMPYGIIDNPEVLKHFNQNDFYIIIGLGVGGNSNFPPDAILKSQNLLKKSHKPHLKLREEYGKFVWEQPNFLVKSVKVYPTYKGEV